MTSKQLHAAVGDVSPDGLLASIAEESHLTLWLPSMNGVPLASRSESARPSSDQSVLAAFRVPTLALGPADAMDLLSGLSSRADAHWADSLRFWRRLGRFVVGALAKQQFVPDLLEAAEGRFEARWRLTVFERDEIAWLERFVTAMPAECRAVATIESAPQDPVRLVDTFLSETTDAVIRRSLANDEFFEDLHRRARRESRWELGWLSALVGKDVGVYGDAEELGIAVPQVQSWNSQTGVDDEVPPRLIFRLIEPPNEAHDDEASWRLVLELRAGSDDSAFDLPTVWSRRSEAATVLGRRWSVRRAQVRAELGRAAGVFVELKKLLNAPDGLTLTTNQAYAFLRDISPLLTAEGFTVELPEWARESFRRLGLHLSVRPLDRRGGDVGLGGMGLGSMLDFNWRVAVGEDQLSLEEFEQLVRSKSPLVRLRRRWASFDREAAERALEFLHQQDGSKMTLLSALRLVGGAEEWSAGLPIVGLSGEAWVQQFLRDAPNFEVEPLPQPEAFSGTLRPYQLRGLAWMSFLDRLDIGACLADDMGLGKTIQMIAVLLHERANKSVDDEPIGPTLLFAPMSVVGNWEREIQRFSPSLKVLVHHGPQRLVGESFIEAAKLHDVVITTYGLASRCLKDFQRVRWHRIAMDEAQKIKNPSAAQTIALRTMNAPHRVALTGTPVENHLSELWSIMEVLNPGLLGSASTFRARYSVPIEKLGDQERAAQLRRMIRPFLLRRLKSDPTVAVDLPEKMEMRVYCNLTAEQAAFYERTVNEVLNDVDQAAGIRRRGLILAALTKLKQICNHPAHFLKAVGPLDGRSGKCERLVEMLEEVLEEGDAALVFTQYREMGDLLEKLMSTRLGVPIPYLHGGTPMKKRNDLILEFQEGKAHQPIFLLSLKAGGFGLNLTKANHVFHFDRWWNPAVEDQATDRAHRIGQTRRVQVHKFVCVGTVEERIDRLLTEKSALADRIVGSGDEWLTGLSTQELRQYLQLSSEAVSDS